MVTSEKFKTGLRCPFICIVYVTGAQDRCDTNLKSQGLLWRVGLTNVIQKLFYFSWLLLQGDSFTYVISFTLNFPLKTIKVPTPVLLWLCNN